ncbi:hypothetical protein B0H15DRAFT_950409 [Mycena belliarum]|uniref:Uncharacterized protein n=1 Tax=Mycena belliarum TaxID=1033014 RepID=A0AAD6XTU5_9AGAR|nr:hypothetical protein B0H15DRAFT_950409 [Mycena belliae]
MSGPPTAQAAFSWGPGISVPPPPSRHPIPAAPAPWNEIKFTPCGAYDVRRHLGALIDELGRFNRSRHKFIASDVAFIAAGSSLEGGHEISPNLFFPEFHDLYESLPPGKEGQNARKVWNDKVRQLIWDLCTKWDRSTGGTTMVMHVAGTTVPGAPLVPERLKAHVYLPPHFIAENPDAHGPVASIVQTFFEAIGIPTAAAWRHRALQIWSLTQHGHLPPITLPTCLIPPPTSPRSAHYIFSGHPFGQLPLLAPPASASTSGPPSSDLYGVDDVTLDGAELEHVLALERIEDLELENAALRKALESLKSDFAEREQMHEAEIDDMAKLASRLEQELSATKVSFSTRRSTAPSTPPRQPPAYAAHLRSPRPAGSQGSPGSWRPPPSARDEAPLCITDAYLNDNGLPALIDSIHLIARLVSPFYWGAEVARLSGLPDELTEGLLQAMASDNGAE